MFQMRIRTCKGNIWKHKCTRARTSFYCEETDEWRANISCDDTHDVIQLEN